jgi:hypothetical protein
VRHVLEAIRNVICCLTCGGRGKFNQVRMCSRTESRPSVAGAVGAALHPVISEGAQFYCVDSLLKSPTWTCVLRLSVF